MLTRVPKAAERWIGKNSPEPCRDIIRVQGLLAHRPPGRRRAGQRRCCGMGPMRGLALAGVLGVAAEDIRVRDRPE
jgi:hypothetical protein